MDRAYHQLSKSSARSGRHKTSNARQLQPNTNTRYSARFLILTYAQTTTRFDPFEIERLASRWQAKCTIVQQARPNGSFNYFAFIDFVGKRFQTRNLNCFDIQGHHPKWLHLNSSPWRHRDQMMHRGEVICDNVTPPTETASHTDAHPSAKKVSASSTSTQWELLGSADCEASFLDMCASQLPEESLEVVASIIGRPVHNRNETAISRNVRYWQDGFRAGFEAARSGANGSKETNEYVPPPEKLNDASFDDLSQLGDDSHPPRPAQHGTAFDSDDSLFLNIDGIDENLISIDWESFELSNTSTDLTA